MGTEYISRLSPPTQDPSPLTELLRSGARRLAAHRVAGPASIEALRGAVLAVGISTGIERLSYVQHNVLYAPPESAYTPLPCSPELLPAGASGRPPPPARHAATPALFSPSERAERRFWEFFTAHIRNPNTRIAYLAAVRRFAVWCERRGLTVDQVEPMLVAAYVEELTRARSPATVKQHLAALRMLFDWLVVGQVLPFNPASSVRGPKHVVKSGKTPVLSAKETRALLDGIDVMNLVGLRDRAFLGVLVYSFARVTAAVSLRVADYYTQGRVRSSGSTRKADGTTSSPPTTWLKATSTPTSRPPESARTAAGPSSGAASPGGAMCSRKEGCRGWVRSR